MTTRISTKLAALGLALTLNMAFVGGVAYLFDGRLHDHAPVVAVQGSVAGDLVRQG